MDEEKKYPKEKKLVNISDYAEYRGIDRRKVYRLLEAGVITRYVDPDGEPLLDPEEVPAEDPDDDLE